MPKEPDQNKRRANPNPRPGAPRPASGKPVQPGAGGNPSQNLSPQKRPGSPPEKPHSQQASKKGTPQHSTAAGKSARPGPSTASGTPAVGNPAAKPKPVAKRNKSTLIVLVVLLAAAAGVGVFLDYLPNPFKPKANYDQAVNAYTLGDFKTAMAHFKVLADRGNAEAMWYVADMYQNGRGVARNTAAAVEWFQKSAQQNQPWALFEIGWYHKNGTGGFQRNASTALEWFEKSGDGGYELGQYHAAMAYMEGVGTEKDLNKAREWFTRAADQGHLDSQAHLGDMYYHGKSVKIDDKKAHAYVKTAAARGHPLAQMNLAMMYENGDVVKKDIVQAYQWYKLAAARGNRDAQRSLDFITPKLSASKKQKADAWIARFEPAP